MQALRLQSRDPSKLSFTRFWISCLSLFWRARLTRNVLHVRSGALLGDVALKRLPRVTLQHVPRMPCVQSVESHKHARQPGSTTVSRSHVNATNY
jgi:hypothetical protein